MQNVAMPHQVEGALFLSNNKAALLADAPRVGKTGAAIMAADDILASRILVVTTASGRGVWQYQWPRWSHYKRTVEVVAGTAKASDAAETVSVIGWAAADKLLAAGATWDAIIFDESHYAKNPEAKRASAVFGPDGLHTRAPVRWCLTGTPIPNGPNDLFTTLRAIAPERLTTDYGPTDVSTYSAFTGRYCHIRKKRLSRWRTIDVVVGGKNERELSARLDGFIMRRTQADVGITAPQYDLLPICIAPRELEALERDLGPDADLILAAAETGETRGLDMALGTLRRLTGSIKARGVAQAVVDDLASGIDRVVLMCWHHDVMDHLESALGKYGVVRVDGTTPDAARAKAQDAFSRDGGPRVFLGQITACGEAIDLSASAELIFVESSFVPKDMQQASLRITNHGQRRQPRVRVAALAGSIDEALQAVLLRKVSTIKEILAWQK